MEQEIQLLQQRIDKLEQIVNYFVYPDRYQFERTLQHKGNRLGFYGILPITQPSIGVGASDHTGSGGTTVTTNMLFDGNLGGTGYGIGDLVTNLKDLGLLKQ